MKQRWGNHYAQLAVPGLVIGLHPAAENMPIRSGSLSVGFTTDDFEAAKKLLESLSMSFTTRDEESGQFIHFTDPDGTELYFIKPKW